MIQCSILQENENLMALMYANYGENILILMSRLFIALFSAMGSVQSKVLSQLSSLLLYLTLKKLHSTSRALVIW